MAFGATFCQRVVYVGLSALMSAVKSRDRTEQYGILAALYCLDAHINPVTAKQVKDLLELHLGKNAPSNVNASLRTYKNYVEPAAKGPPLLWSLMPAGLDHLRELSGLNLTSSVRQADYDTDVGFVCALDYPEFAALINATGGERSWHSIGNPSFPHVYRATELTTDHGKQLKVVGTTATSMGLTAAAIATTQMILQFKPRIVAMVGIAAGTRSGNKQFGDVLIADPSVDYNSGKVVREKGIREFLPDPYPIGLNPRLRSVLNRYRTNDDPFTAIRAKWTGKIPKVGNRLHMGPVGAADQVIDDASRVVEIQRNWRKLIGVEMETYGVYRACHEAPEPKPRVVSFKAVCDFAAEKGDSWQEYAAFVAAEIAVRFFKAEWDALWPNL